MSYTRLFSIALAACTAILASALLSQAGEEDWGTIKGRFVYDGKAPQPTPIVPTKDTEFCGKHKLVVEDVVVGEKGGLANLVMFLSPKRGQTVSVHPDYQKTASEKVVLDNKNCRFEPHVALLRTTQKLVVKNSDPVGHNTNIAFISPANRSLSFNETIPAGTELVKELNFRGGERILSPVVCNIHPWMKGYVLVQEHPYMAVSAKDGKFEIKHVPVGEHEFVLWHGKFVGDLDLGPAKTSRRGRVTLNVPGGDTLDLGEIKVAPKLLAD